MSNDSQQMRAIIHHRHPDVEPVPISRARARKRSRADIVRNRDHSVARERDLSFVWTGCLIDYGSENVPALTRPEIGSGAELIAAFFAGKREVGWCACVTRTEELRRIGPIADGQICGDMFFWIKLASQAQVGCVSAPVSHHTFMTADDVSAGAPVSGMGQPGLRAGGRAPEAAGRRSARGAAPVPSY
jgi:hypothetical protein